MFEFISLFSYCLIMLFCLLLLFALPTFYNFFFFCFDFSIYAVTSVCVDSFRCCSSPQFLCLAVKVTKMTAVIRLSYSSTFIAVNAETAAPAKCLGVVTKNKVGISRHYLKKFPVPVSSFSECHLIKLLKCFPYFWGTTYLIDVLKCAHVGQRLTNIVKPEVKFADFVQPQVCAQLDRFCRYTYLFNSWFS